MDENGPFAEYVQHLLKMVVSNSYVSLPEGKSHYISLHTNYIPIYFHDIPLIYIYIHLLPKATTFFRQADKNFKRQEGDLSLGIVGKDRPRGRTVIVVVSSG